MHEKAVSVISIFHFTLSLKITSLRIPVSINVIIKYTKNMDACIFLQRMGIYHYSSLEK